VGLAAANVNNWNGVPEFYPYPGTAPSSYQTYNSDTDVTNLTFSFEQSVQGNGYWMTYKYAKMGNLQFKDYVHGSGSIDNENTLVAQALHYSMHPYYADWYDFNQSCIQFKEDNAMVYAPMNIAVGTGYYAAHPVAYDSLLKEKTWGKNLRSGTVMHQEIEYAHAIDKELDLTLKEKWNHTYDPVWEQVGVTQMRINEDVTDGKIHIAVIQAGSIPQSDPYTGQIGAISTVGWKNPSIDIDEDYWGTYHVEKNMTLEVPYKRVQKNEDWLPCCSGGWETMPLYAQRGFGASTAGIFDCTCFKLPGQSARPATA
jgi:hypothetical protein